MIEQSRISQLAKIVQIRTSDIESFLIHRGIPLPSFDYATPSDLPPELYRAQHELLEASDELTALIQGPHRFCTTLGYEHNKFNSVQAILRFGLAKAFPIDQTSTFDDLGRMAGLTPDEVSQLLRHAMTYRIFSEPSPGVVAHTASSQVLATDENLIGQLQFSFDELWPAASRMVDAMERWPQSEEPNQSGFNVANATEDWCFRFFDKYPARADKLARAMCSFMDTPPFSTRYLVEGIDWMKVKKVVDVGGSGGSVCIDLAREFSHLRCIVQDLRQALGTASLPSEFKERMSLMEHDFFSEQPVQDADVYLLRRILHDWSDTYAAKILRALIPALQKDARIIINDSILPEHGVMSLYDQRLLRVTSLTMRQIQNAKERDADDWRKLLKLADERLELREIKCFEGSALAILVVALRDHV